MSKAVVEVEQLNKVFKDFWRRPQARAVSDLTFRIEPGEVFGLLGPNGSGKSTTIKMLLGLLHPTSGRVAVLGRHAGDVGVKARIGYLPEESWLYPWLTASETLDFYGKLFDLDRAERRRRTVQLLEMVGLQHTGNRRVGEFSKGMARRVGLAQALINDPDFIILDEPTSGLDPIGCRQVKDLIQRLAERGKTILLCSHLLADVEDVCHRIAILYGGRMQACGSVKELLSVDEHVQIRLPRLEPEALREVLAALRVVLGHEPELETPTRDLEEYFLRVIEQARKAGLGSSGAASTRSVADYLRPESASSSPTQEAAVPTPSQESPTPAAPSREDIKARLDALTSKDRTDAP